MSCLRSAIPGLRATSQVITCTPVAVPVTKTIHKDEPTGKAKLAYSAGVGVKASTSLFGHTSVRGIRMPYTDGMSVTYPNPGKVSKYEHIPTADLPKPDYSAVRHEHWEQALDKDERRIQQQLPSYVALGMVGGLGLYMVKYAAIGLVRYMGPARDVMAAGAVEIDLTQIPEGKNVTVEWRGKPLFIRHRSDKEIEAANAVDISQLRDPETDIARFPRQRFLVVIGICTHLGCIPISHMGDYNGYFCPCHGSHYDTSARIHRGPAPLNLEIPPYEYVDDNTIIVGRED